MHSQPLLLVDDDPQMGVLVGLLARRGGWSLTCRSDVESAWAALQSERPCLVLLDLNLPGESGLELLRRRESLGGERLAVALFCQSTLHDDVAAGWRAGADYLLPKELVTRAADWQQRVREILAHTHGQGERGSLGCPAEAGGALASTWGESVNRALDHPALRSLGTEVIDAVLQRALASGFGAAVRPSWRIPGAARLACGELPPAPSIEAARDCLASLLDQVWCLLGSQPCASLEAAVRADLAKRT
jgi:CheY-like chemotaxis protein